MLSKRGNTDNTNSPSITKNKNKHHADKIIEDIV